MKFAQCNYSSYENVGLGLKLKAGDIFIVDSRIENSPSFVEGINSRNFTFITPSPQQLSTIKGLTEDMKREFLASIEDKTTEPMAEPIPEPTPVAPTTEVQPEEKTEDELPTTPEEEEPSGLCFTEEAGNVQKALKLVAVETDIEKLKIALQQDERKSVKRAIVYRLKELQK